MRHELLPCKRNRRRHTQLAARNSRRITHAREALRNTFILPARLIDKTLSRLRQPHAARGALHQPHTRGALQFSGSWAHGGLAYAKPRGRARVAALLREDCQPVEMRPERLDS